MNQNNKEFNPIGIVQDPISFDKTEEIKTVEDVKVADTKIVNEYKEESKQVVEPEVEQQPVVTQTETPVKQELVLMLKNVKQYRQIGNILPRKTARRINIHIQNVQKKRVRGTLFRFPGHVLHQ